MRYLMKNLWEATVRMMPRVQERMQRISATMHTHTVRHPNTEENVRPSHFTPTTLSLRRRSTDFALMPPSTISLSQLGRHCLVEIGITYTPGTAT